MEKKTLDILSDAISDVGSWQWWHSVQDLFQLEFCDVMLYDETTPEKAPHSSMIALRFIDHSFAVFLDNLDEEQGKARGHERSHDESLLVAQLVRVAELQRLACGLQHESALPLVRQSEDGEAVHFWRTI